MQRLTAFIAVISLLLLNLSACGSDPDLEAIREGIRNISVAAENHDTQGVVDYIDNSYQGVGANLQGVTELLQRHFSANKNINLIISNIEIKIADDRQTAKVDIRVLMTGGEGNLPERGRLSAIKSRWGKLDGEWKVIDAAWKPVLLQF